MKIVLIVMASTVTVLYFDLRVRRDGTIDMEMLTQRVGLTGGAAFGADWQREQAPASGVASSAPVPAAPDPPRPAPRRRPIAPSARGAASDDTQHNQPGSSAPGETAPDA